MYQRGLGTGWAKKARGPMRKLFSRFLRNESGAVGAEHGSISAGTAAERDGDAAPGKPRGARAQVRQRLGRLVGPQGANGSREQAARRPVAGVSNGLPDRGDA